MATTFDIPLNNVRTTVGSAYTAGSGSLVLASGGGAQFGSTFPLRVTVVTAGTYGSYPETLTIFGVTGRSTDTLTVAAIEGSTDRNYAVGDVVEMRATASSFADLHTAVNNLENAANPLAFTFYGGL